MTKTDVIKIRAKIFNPVIGLLVVLLCFTSLGPMLDFYHGRHVRWEILLYGFIGTCIAIAFFSGLAVEVTSNRITVLKLYFYKEVTEFSDVVGWKKASGRPIGGGLPIPRIEVFVKGKEIPIMIPIKPFKKEDVDLLIGALTKACGEQMSGKKAK